MTTEALLVLRGVRYLLTELNWLQKKEKRRCPSQIGSRKFHFEIELRKEAMTFADLREYPKPTILLERMEDIGLAENRNETVGFRCLIFELVTPKYPRSRSAIGER